MKKSIINILIKSLLAGIAVGIAVLIYLLVENQYLGAFLFSFGLLVVCTFNLNLYTGKVGYIITEKKTYILDILLMILGNLIGVLIVAGLYLLMDNQVLIEAAKEYSALKLENEWYQTLILAFFCGILMYVGVEGFKLLKNGFLKVLLVVLAVMIFILAKFEHSIANLVYFTLGGWSLKAILYFFLHLIGNGLGAAIICFLQKVLTNTSNNIDKEAE